MTSRQIFFNRRVVFRPTCCAFFVLTNRLILAIYSAFDNTGLFATQSARSIARSLLRNHAQKHSTGFRSGDLGGTCQRLTFSSRCAALATLECKKRSLSHKTNQGPFFCTGLRSRIAFRSLPARTAFPIGWRDLLGLGVEANYGCASSRYASPHWHSSGERDLLAIHVVACEFRTA